MSKPEGPEISIKDAIEGFLIEHSGGQYSRYTLRNYRLVFRRLLAYLDPTTPIADITRRDIAAFMGHLANLDQSPAGIAPRPSKPLSKKTLRNHHTALSALWTWVTDNQYAPEHIVRQVNPPQPGKPEIHPYNNHEIKAMLGACKKTSEYTHIHTGDTTANTRPTHLRDRAILLLLLDTGLRASELCNISEESIDLQARAVTVIGKGNKERTVPFSTKTSRAVWEYTTQEREPNPNERKPPLFLNTRGRPLTRNALLKLCHRIGKRANVKGANVHRWRHTFATLYLKNRGDVYTLQRILGHSTLDMVNRYLELSRADVADAHRTASPVENL